MPPAVTVAWEQLAAATAPAWHPLAPVARQASAHARHAAAKAWYRLQPHVQPATDAIDAHLERHLGVSVLPRGVSTPVRNAETVRPHGI